MPLRDYRQDRGVHAARELRGQRTPAEQALWHALRNRRLAGLKFRRQHPVGPFVLDFCCPEHRLAIELDGPIHNLQTAYDAERSHLLTASGYRILRFPNHSVVTDLPTVLTQISAAAKAPPLPRTGEGAGG